MDTNVFRYVLAVAECRSISRAARKLFISQPALTKQLGKLESELGYKIFDRNRSPLTPTPSGELFLKFASRYCDLENTLKEEINQLSRPEFQPLPGTPIPLQSILSSQPLVTKSSYLWNADWPCLCNAPKSKRIMEWALTHNIVRRGKLVFLSVNYKYVFL